MCIKGQLVSFRVSEIEDITNVADWRYVLSHLNTADDVTNRNMALQIKNSYCWFGGLLLLIGDDTNSQDEITLTYSTEEEMKREV